MKHTLLQLDGSEQPQPKANADNNHVVTLSDALKFAEGVAASDTGLGGWLKMSRGTQSFAYLLLQFANPRAYLEELTDLLAPDRKATTQSANAPTPVTLKKRNEAE